MGQLCNVRERMKKKKKRGNKMNGNLKNKNLIYLFWRESGHGGTIKKKKSYVSPQNKDFHLSLSNDDDAPRPRPRRRPRPAAVGRFLPPGTAKLATRRGK